ncbi:MAG: hypothetical protein WBE18_02960 [Gammaproteobacteria bacterium]
MKSKPTLEQLKKLTTKKEQDLSIPAEYFFDLLENPHFFNQGEVLKEQLDFYRTLLIPISQYYGETVEIASLLLVQKKTEHFIHGSFMLSNQAMGAFYFFEEVQMGMAIISRGGMTHFFRLTAFLGEGEFSEGTIFLPADINSDYH